MIQGLEDLKQKLKSHRGDYIGVYAPSELLGGLFASQKSYFLGVISDKGPCVYIHGNSVKINTSKKLASIGINLAGIRIKINEENLPYNRKLKYHIGRDELMECIPHFDIIMEAIGDPNGWEIGKEWIIQ
jgi:hypothetical protein